VSAWLSVVIPTAGQRQAGLLRTIDSVRWQPQSEDVEVLVVADTYALADRLNLEILRDEVAGYPSVNYRWLEHDGGLHCYGQPQRSFGARQARGEWVAFSQDDNILAEGALRAMWQAVTTTPRKRPLFFKVLTPWRAEIWSEPRLAMADIDADCLVLPKEVAQQVSWGLRYEGDFDCAVAAMQLAGGDVGWCEAQIAIARPDAEHIWW
jgi:Glycosyl transferase family 2